MVYNGIKSQDIAYHGMSWCYLAYHLSMLVSKVEIRWFRDFVVFVANFENEIIKKLGEISFLNFASKFFSFKFRFEKFRCAKFQFRDFVFSKSVKKLILRNSFLRNLKKKKFCEIRFFQIWKKTDFAKFVFLKI